MNETETGENVVYLTIEAGDFLGLVDFVPSEEEIKTGVHVLPK